MALRNPRNTKQPHANVINGAYNIFHVEMDVQGVFYFNTKMKRLTTLLLLRGKIILNSDRLTGIFSFLHLIGGGGTPCSIVEALCGILEL